MEKETFEGCKNRPTWCVALHIRNDEWLWQMAQAQRSAGELEECFWAVIGYDTLPSVVQDLLPDDQIDWQEVFECTREEED